jgi:predicted NAD/FAD-binding protein
MMEFPLRFFLKFFNNHGMLSVDNRPQWRVITGGSQSYVEPLIQPFKDNIHLNSPIASVKRSASSVTVKTFSGEAHEFDQVVFACHSDQVLGMLDEPSQAEDDILGAIPYQRNEVVLHTDRRLMPKRKLAWAAWNYHIPQRHSEYAMVTYHMNALQNFDEAPDDFMVTLNRTAEIAPGKIIDKYDYAHPVFTMDGIAAQQRHSEINNKNRSHFCGAYWFNGFHEDGVNSALRVAKSFGIEL